MTNQRTTSGGGPRVAISIEFMKSFSALPSPIRKKVHQTLTKFQISPGTHGLNLEKIAGAADATMRSLRVGDNYRAVVSQTGDIYFFCWVDKHDEAYRWAMNKKLIVSPSTGALELIAVEPIPEPSPAPGADAEKPAKQPGLFDRFSDEQLRDLGVPDELLPSVRAIVTEEDLDDREGSFPPVVYFPLLALACGDSYDEVLAEYGRLGDTPVDTSDFSKALDSELSVASFKVIDSSIELQDLLNAPLERWRVFLHPRQRKLVEMSASGPVRVLGSAGTGKTVVAIHRARHLAKKVFTGPNDRILLTTFTKNLAADIRGYLEQICEPDILKRIEVKNIDAWAWNYLKKKGYGAAHVTEEKQKTYWQNALAHRPEEKDFSEQFYKDEWNQIIQPQNIETVERYYRASRLGRGRRLDRKDRKAIWPVFDAYRAELVMNNAKEFEDIYRDAAELLRRDGNQTGYRAVIVDEAQDLSLSAFRMIRHLVPEGPNDLFLVGDARQRIYGYKSSLSAAGINIRGRGKRLYVNYRTTRQTYHYASAVLEGIPFDDLDGEEDPRDGCRSLTSGEPPRYRVFNDSDGELEGIAALAQRFRAENIPLETVCLACRTGALLQRYRAFFASRDIPCHEITGEQSHRAKEPGIRIATMHRIKGIEFDYLILASACEGIIPLREAVDPRENPTDRKLAEKQERSLLYVALTRARKGVFITGYGEKSPYLR